LKLLNKTDVDGTRDRVGACSLALRTQVGVVDTPSGGAEGHCSARGQRLEVVRSADQQQRAATQH